MLLHAVEALACPRCFGSSASRVIDAYWLTGALLLGLPFLLVGGIGFWLWRRTRPGAWLQPSD